MQIYKSYANAANYGKMPIGKFYANAANFYLQH